LFLGLTSEIGLTPARSGKVHWGNVETLRVQLRSLPPPALGKTHQGEYVQCLASARLHRSFARGTTTEDGNRDAISIDGDMPV
jgi:hypothetical protein